MNTRKIFSIVIFTILFGSLSLMGKVFFIQQAHAAWYNANWGYRKQITINHGNVTATQTNFPVLVSISSDTNLSSHALSNGFDILFTQSDGTTKLSHEREHYNSGTGELEAWVKIPSLSSSSDTIIYVYYGNASSCDQAASACDSTNNSTQVWDTNYKIIYHMGETSGSSISDSTSNTITATKYKNTTVSTTDPAPTSSGQIDGAQSFISANTAWLRSSNSDLPTGDFTYEFWVKFTNVSAQMIFDSADQIYMDYNSSSANDITAHVNGALTNTTVPNISSGSWYHVVLTRSSSTTTMYLNGSSDDTGSNGTTINYGTCTYLDVGADTTDGCNGPAATLNGTLDEFRVSNIARSSTWIATEYNNQHAPSSFITVGSETNKGFPSSASYTLQNYGFGAGGTNTNTTSASYKLFGIVGETEFGKPTSAHYGAGTGLNFLLKLNVPPSPTVSNPGNTYDRLKIVLNQGGNASDVLYAISISTSSTFASNVNYIKADYTMGTTLTTHDYYTYAGWNGSSGFFVTGLSPNVTYYVRARAKVSGFSETEWGPISSGTATANPTLSFSTNNSSITFTALTPGNSYTDSSQSTVLTTTTNAYDGYVIYAKETRPLTSGNNTISNYSGTNTNPTSWSGNGFGYTTNDNNLTVGPGTTTRFNSATNYAGFSTTSTSPGDPVADDLGPVQNSEISNEQFTVSYKVVGTNTTASGTYSNFILYTIVPAY